MGSLPDWLPASWLAIGPAPAVFSVLPQTTIPAAASTAGISGAARQPAIATARPHRQAPSCSGGCRCERIASSSTHPSRHQQQPQQQQQQKARPPFKVGAVTTCARGERPHSSYSSTKDGATRCSVCVKVSDCTCDADAASSAARAVNREHGSSVPQSAAAAATIASASASAAAAASERDKSSSRLFRRYLPPRGPYTRPATATGWQPSHGGRGGSGDAYADDGSMLADSDDEWLERVQRRAMMARTGGTVAASNIAQTVTFIR